VLLLLATGATATVTQAQYPASKRKTSAVGTVLPADTHAAPKTGSVRQLVCRGSSGLHVATEQDPSPRNPRLVTVSIRYRRSSGPVGPQYENLEPGTCSWNNGGLTGIPAEPGVVHFDIDRNGSAAVPDPTTLLEYLRDQEHYWVFYVDDVTNLSLSHGVHRGRFWAGDKRDGKHRRTTVAGGASAGSGGDTSRTAVGPPPAPPPPTPAPSAPSGVVGGLRDASPAVSMPARGVGGARTPGAADFGTGTLIQATPRLVRVLADPVRNRLLIVFTARPNASPTVFYSRRQPVKDPGSGRWLFQSGGYQMNVAAGTPEAFRAEYRASSFIPGDREESTYHYIITVPATADAVEQQLTGQFTMQGRVPPPPSDGFETNAN
jgi:hypothetical protein